MATIQPSALQDEMQKQVAALQAQIGAPAAATPCDVTVKTDGVTVTGTVIAK